MAKIETLTPEEEALIPIVRDEWLKIGLATGPADRSAAQSAIADAYRLARLAPPKLWIWLDSPWAGCLGAWLLAKLPATGGQLCARVEEQAESEVGKQVRDQVENWVLDQVSAQVGAQLQDQVRAQVRDHLWSEALAKVGTKVSPQARTQVVAQVAEQVSAQAADQLGAEMWEQVGPQVWDHSASQVWNQIGNQVWDQLWKLRDQRSNAGFGSHDANWLAVYDLFRRMKRVNGPERLEPLMRLAMTAGWWWPFRRVCIITERPSALHRDAAFRLHSDTRPALAYPDGWSIHAWHGRSIPAWLIEEKHKITPDAIEAEKNAELRRVMLEIFGFDRYIEAHGARLIAEDECLGLPRQLFEIDLQGERFRVLHVVNGTVEADGRQRQFHLGVPVECNTPHEAVAWSYGRPQDRYREAIRT